MQQPPPDIIDSPTPWVASQIEEYLATDGAKPVFRYNSPLLLLTTQGGKSGQWRRSCLIYGPHGGDFLIVASMGGAPKHPSWYLNLKANPRVWLQVGADSFWAVARDASEEEKPELWQKMVDIYPEYAEYQEKTDRAIPVVVLERDEQGSGQQ